MDIPEPYYKVDKGMQYRCGRIPFDDGYITYVHVDGEMRAVFVPYELNKDYSLDYFIVRDF